MKLNSRQRLCLLILLLTVSLTVIVWLTMPDPILSGVQIHNGVKSLTYTPKNKLCITAVCAPIVGSLVWNWLVSRTDRKIAAEPHLQSLKLRRSLINFFGLLYTSVGVWGNLLVLILNM